MGSNAVKCVVHSTTEAYQRACGEICDRYCKWPEIIASEEQLWEKFCKTCPMNLITEANA